MRRAAIAAVYAIACAAGLGIAFQPTIESRFERMQTDPGDTLFNHYILEHTWRAVSDANFPHSLISPPFFYPQKHVLGYSEPLLGVAPAYWFLRFFFAPVVAFSLWMMAMSALNFFSFAVMARWLKLSHPLALLGGWLWAFAAVHVYQMGHQQLVPRFWIPFAVYQALRFVESPRPNYLSRGLLLTALQTSCCVNTGVFLGYGLLTYCIVALSLKQGGWRNMIQMTRQHRRAFIVAFALGLAACAVVLLPLVIANAGDGFVRGYENAVQFMPSPQAWLAPPPGWLYDRSLGQNRDGINSENWLFGGLGFAVLLGLTLVSWTRRSLAYPAHVCGITAIFLALMVTDFSGDGLSAWWLARFLPGGMTVRVVGRVYVMVYFFITLGGLMAIGTRWVDEGRSKTVAYASGSVLAVLLIVEQAMLPTPSFAAAEVTNQVETLTPLLAGADVAYVKGTSRDRWEVHGQLIAMWAGLQANVPVVNGYSGRLPPNYPFESDWSDNDLRRWLGPGFRGCLAIVDPDRQTVRILQLP